MPFNISEARPLLQNCRLRELFVEHLGWEPNRQKLKLPAGGRDYPFTAIAEKKGFTAWLCESVDETIPDNNIRLKLDRQLSETSYEHLIIFVTADKARQSWMWVRREPGRPLRPRSHDFNRGESGDSLLQKINHLYVSLEEEEKGLSVTEVSGRARQAFDVDRVTKKFYDQFKKEHAAFLGFIGGIPVQADAEWYASVMLNRLMFVYFIQAKGFLDGDLKYLRSRLQRMRVEHGKDKFYSFYRYFLLRLFREGLGKKKRPPELEKLVGKVPYLNGGMFDVHELEKPDRYGDEIQIPDKAFEGIFDYFDKFDWVLDPKHVKRRPGDKEEINPDVLGYIFEKYINQKQMGAYYTKEDITGYIGQNTILPFLFDAARAQCKVAFENPGGPTVWDLLRENPDRYIYPAVRHGVTWDIHTQKTLEKTLELPEDIAEGVGTVSKRTLWNKAAPPEFALPTEIWREVVARRKRYEDVKARLASGEVREINDLITFNLDIGQFAEDVIRYCEGSELLRAFWHSIENVTILDPTCGSGAFLFAALNILERLYEACLDRMEAFIADDDRSTDKRGQEKFKDLREIRKLVASHPNRNYFIFKSIILKNLYGVDIMEEAVEICKLRLFLKLAAQVEPNRDDPNLGIEPLPDIDFNIRAGNTLVGYATANEVHTSMTTSLKASSKEAVQLKFLLADEDADYKAFIAQLETVAEGFEVFRQQQIELGSLVGSGEKSELQKSLKALDDRLNHLLANDYGIKVKDKAAYAQWLKSHQPFHWFVEFYAIISNGGFDVIIGNPPYVEYKEVKNEYQIKNFDTEESGNLYAFVLERSFDLAQPIGRLGLIVPISLIAAQRMAVLQQLIIDHSDVLHLSSFGLRPAALFPGIMQRLTIFTALKGKKGVVFTSDYITWYADERDQLFSVLKFFPLGALRLSYSIPKANNILAHNALMKIFSKKRAWIHHNQFRGEHRIFYHNAGGYWVKTFDFKPYYKSFKDEEKNHTTISELCFPSSDFAYTYLGILSSSLFYFFWKSLTDARHIYPSDIALLPIELPLKPEHLRSIQKLDDKLMAALKRNRKRLTYGDAEVDQFYVAPCKPIIDEIDRVLAKHYGFTDEELDFIINYDIKYRMGREAEE